MPSETCIRSMIFEKFPNKLLFSANGIDFTLPKIKKNHHVAKILCDFKRFLIPNHLSIDLYRYFHLEFNLISNFMTENIEWIWFFCLKFNYRTVVDLKARLERLINIPAAKMRLYYVDQDLRDTHGPEEMKYMHKQLYSYNIRDGDEIIIDQKR